MKLSEKFPDFDEKQLATAASAIQERGLTPEDLNHERVDQIRDLVAGAEADWYYKAKIEVTVGKRSMNRLMRSAGLGITGVGTKSVSEVTYNPGVAVDEARILRAFTKVRRMFDEENSEDEIIDVKVLSLEKRTVPHG